MATLTRLAVFFTFNLASKFFLWLSIVEGLDGAFSDAEFDYPNGVSVDATGNLYVADSNSTRIRKLTIE